MDSKVCECCQELTGGFPLCLDQFFFEKNDLQRPKMLKKWFLVIFKAHSPLRQKNGIFKRDQTQNHACLTQTNDFIPYTNIYNQIIIWGPYLAISGQCAVVVSKCLIYPDVLVLRTVGWRFLASNATSLRAALRPEDRIIREVPGGRSRDGL